MIVCFHMYDTAEPNFDPTAKWTRHDVLFAQGSDFFGYRMCSDRKYDVNMSSVASSGAFLIFAPKLIRGSHTGRIQISHILQETRRTNVSRKLHCCIGFGLYSYRIRVNGNVALQLLLFYMPEDDWKDVVKRKQNPWWVLPWQGKIYMVSRYSHVLARTSVNPNIKAKQFVFWVMSHEVKCWLSKTRKKTKTHAPCQSTLMAVLTIKYTLKNKSD